MVSLLFTGVILQYSMFIAALGGEKSSVDWGPAPLLFSVLYYENFLLLALRKTEARWLHCLSSFKFLSLPTVNDLYTYTI